MVPGIAAEQFVRAFARQADGRAALLDGRAEQQQRGVYVRHAGQSARFGGRAERSADRLRVEHDAVMMRAEKIRHQRRKIAVIGRLKAVFDEIPLVFTIIDRPGVKRLVPGRISACGDGRQDGRVEAARQKAGERDVADELPLRSIGDEVVGALNGRVEVVLMLVRLQAPVGGPAEPFGRQHGKAAGQERGYAAEYAAFGRPRRAEQQHGAQTVLIEHRLGLRVAEHGVDGRAEHKTAARRTAEQRLDAQTVAHEDEPPLGLLPEREGKNAVEPREGVRIPFEKGVQHDLGIRAAAENMAEGGERIPYLVCVVQLAVVDEHGVPVGREHGLRAALGVDDDQPAVHERRVGVGVGAGRIRPARPEPAVHRAEHRAAAPRVAVEIDKASNSAHEKFPPVKFILPGLNICIPKQPVICKEFTKSLPKKSQMQQMRAFMYSARTFS